MDPNGEPGPKDCGASIEDCQISPEDISETGPSDAEMLDAVTDAFSPEPVRYVPHPEDGLPVIAGEDFQLSLPPDFTYSNVICVEDERRYVEVFFNEDPSLHESFLWELDDNGHCWVGKPILQAWRSIHAWSPLVRERFSPTGDQVERNVYSPSQVARRFGFSFVGTTPVRPIRPACRHYRCQLFNNEEQPDPEKFGGKHLLRACTAKVSVSGAHLCLNNTAVYACDFRDPPYDTGLHEREREKLNKKEEEKSRGGDRVPLFNIGDPEE